MSFLDFWFGQSNDQEFAILDDNEVSWKPVPVKAGDKVQIKYRGLLKDRGAEDLYLYYSFDNWSVPAQTSKMKQQKNGDFTAAVAATGQQLNFCFKDSAENWDNNNGQNWNLFLQPQN